MMNVAAARKTWHTRECGKMLVRKFVKNGKMEKKLTEKLSEI